MDVKTHFKNYIADESGATAIEYGLIAALIAVVVIQGLSRMEQNLTHRFNCLSISLRRADADASSNNLCNRFGHN